MAKPAKESRKKTTPAMYQTCTIKEVNGKDKKTYTDAFLVFGEYVEKSGNEYEVNGLKVVNKTITFTAHYDPRIKADGRLIIYGNTYDITNAENYRMQNTDTICSLKYVGAGA